LSLFDDAKVQRFSIICNILRGISVKKYSILDLNQVLCAKTTDINTFVANCEWLLRIRKSSNKFGFLLTYSYLCTIIYIKV